MIINECLDIFDWKTGKNTEKNYRGGRIAGLMHRAVSLIKIVYN